MSQFKFLSESRRDLKLPGNLWQVKAERGPMNWIEISWNVLLSSLFQSMSSSPPCDCFCICGKIEATFKPYLIGWKLPFHKHTPSSVKSSDIQRTPYAVTRIWILSDCITRTSRDTCIRLHGRLHVSFIFMRFHDLLGQTVWQVCWAVSFKFAAKAPSTLPFELQHVIVLRAAQAVAVGNNSGHCDR